MALHVVKFPLIDVNGFRRLVSKWRPQAPQFGTVRTLTSVLANWMVVAKAVCGGALAQTSGVEIVRPADRNVTPPGILPGPVIDGPLVREQVPVPAADPVRWHRFFLPVTSDAATFVIEELTIRISGVTPPELDISCALADGSPWPCGRTARHALRMFLRGRAVECYFPYAPEVTDVVAPCRVGKNDLGAWLLGNGWAAVSTLATDDYRETEHGARCAQIGIWRGQVRPEDCG